METGAEGENMQKLFEASLRGYVSTLDILLQGDPLILDRVFLSSFNETPLHIASFLGHVDFTMALLRHKPGLSTERNSQGQVPLHLASAEGHTKIVNALLSVNPRVCLVPDQLGRIPLHLAAMRGRVEVIRELVSACPESVMVKLHEQETVLHLCIRYNHLQALQELLPSVTNESEFLNSADQNGLTIMQLAVVKKQPETIKYLVSIPEVKVEADALVKFLTDQKSEVPNSTVETILTRRQTDSAAVLPQDVNRGEPRLFWSASMAKYLDDRGDWLEKTRGNLMIVATLIASLAFQFAINPPGGVWQEEAHYNATNPDGCPIDVCDAGTSILSYQKYYAYYAFIICNTASFSAALCTVILLLLSGYPLKRRPFVWLLLLVMCITLFFMAATYIFSIRLVAAREDTVMDQVVFYYLGFWGLVFALIVLYYAISFLIWLLKKLFIGICRGILCPFQLLLKLCRPTSRQPEVTVDCVEASRK